MPRSLQRAMTALILITAGTIVAGYPATPALAASISYVALGDSYSAGVGAGTYDSASGVCLRSSLSYAPLWAAKHSVTQFRFPACGGAKTTDVLSGQLSALNAGTTLVTITIGGNDVGFVDVISTCIFSSDAGCAAAVDSARAFGTNKLPALLDSTYAAIRSKAPNARLVVLGYPRLFDPTNDCGVLSHYKRQVINAGADELVNGIAAHAAAAGATFVDVRAVFAAHGICAGDQWLNGLEGFLGAYHPNARGYRYGYLAALTAAIG